MNFSGLQSKLRLAYPPVSNYEFVHLKKEQIVQEHIKDSMIYIICQRPMLAFKKLTFNENQDTMYFEIHKRGISEILECEIPLYQKAIEMDENKKVIIEFGTHDPVTNTSSKFENIHGLTFFNEQQEFLFWISPDKFIYEVLNNKLKAKIEGDIKPFISFKVHYVGKATDQKIWNRLTGHNTLQDILSIEKPIMHGTLPTHEISLLLLKVEEVISITFLEDDIDSFVKNALEPSLPSKKTIALDAEKMLINLLNPEHNHPSKRFGNYPVSKDGLYPENYNNYGYQIQDSLILQYKDSEIHGDLDVNKADLILIKNNKSCEIIKLGRI